MYLHWRTFLKLMFIDPTVEVVKPIREVMESVTDNHLVWMAPICFGIAYWYSTAPLFVLLMGVELVSFWFYQRAKSEPSWFKDPGVLGFGLLAGFLGFIITLAEQVPKLTVLGLLVLSIGLSCQIHAARWYLKGRGSVLFGFLVAVLFLCVLNI